MPSCSQQLAPPAWVRGQGSGLVEGRVVATEPLRGPGAKDPRGSVADCVSQRRSASAAAEL